MKYLTRQNNLLKKRSALKTLGLLSLSPALAGLGISSMKDVKEIYDNIPVKNNEKTEEFKIYIFQQNRTISSFTCPDRRIFRRM